MTSIDYQPITFSILGEDTNFALSIVLPYLISDLNH